MLKRIVLAMALILCAASFTVEAAPWGSKRTTATKTKIDQSSKRALMKTFIQALFINQDYDAIWQLFSPEIKKQTIKEAGSEKAAKETFKKEIKKGMAEMDKDELCETTMNIEHRTLRKITIEDAILADQVFETLMGEEVEARRKFIEENAQYVENLDV